MIHGTLRRPVPTLGGNVRRETDFLGRSTRHRADAATLAAIYVAALLLIPARLVLSGIPFALTPADVFALGIGLLWVLTQFTTSLGVAKGATPVRTALFCYAVAMVACYGYATSRYLPEDELNLADHSVVLVFAGVGLALGISDGVRGRERLDLVLKTVVVAGAIVGVIGACQYLFTLDLTQYLVLPGLHYTAEYGFTVERYGLVRAAGTTGHPIEFGVMCAMILPIALSYGFRAKDSGRPSLRWWMCCACIAAGLLFSVSRSAILGLVAGGIVLFIGWPAARRIRALIASVLFLVLVKFTVPGVLGGILGLFLNLSNDSSLQYRTHDYAAAGAEIGKSIWFGRGLGTWYAPKHQVFDNQYILSLVETGVVGLVAFVAVLIIAIGAAVRVRWLTADPPARDLGLALAAALIVPLVGSATFDLRSFATVTGLTFLLVGASGSLLRTALAQRISPPRPAPSARTLRPGRAG